MRYSGRRAISDAIANMLEVLSTDGGRIIIVAELTHESMDALAMAGCSLEDREPDTDAEPEF